MYLFVKYIYIYIHIYINTFIYLYLINKNTTENSSSRECVCLYGKTEQACTRRKKRSLWFGVEGFIGFR